MNEIKETLKIFKARWPEVVLIISLTLLKPLTGKMTNCSAVKQTQLYPQIVHWFFLTVGLLTAIVLTFLYFGFLRTVYTEGCNRQSLSSLLRTGSHFFWRMLGFGLICVIPFLILLFITRHFYPQTLPWINTLCTIILIKILLLIPALIIVLDCGVFESFRMLRQCKLSDAKTLVVLFFLNIALSLFWTFLLQLSSVLPALHFILTLAWKIISAFIQLIITVTAVRFVASLDLVYDNEQINSGFQKPRQ